jgi:hypothetical protein
MHLDGMAVGAGKFLNHFRRFTVLNRNGVTWTHGRHKKGEARSPHKAVVGFDLYQRQLRSAQISLQVIKTFIFRGVRSGKSITMLTIEAPRLATSIREKLFSGTTSSLIRNAA